MSIPKFDGFKINEIQGDDQKCRTQISSPTQGWWIFCNSLYPRLFEFKGLYPLHNGGWVEIDFFAGYKNLQSLGKY